MDEYMVQAHPPVESQSSSNEVGIVDDVVMGQGGTLWSPSRTLITDILFTSYWVYNFIKWFDNVSHGVHQTDSDLILQI